MNDGKHNRPRSGEGDEQAPSGRAVLAFFVMLAIVLVGGYFLLMKLIEISQQEDCMLAGRRNCAAPLVVPAR
jgi:hypothetical protein